MFSGLVSSDAAQRRPVGSARKEAPTVVLQRLSALPKLAGVTAASRLEVRPAPEMVSSGVPAMDALTGGLPRGCLTEVCGPASSGRTSVLVAALAAATGREEVCALVDTTDAFDPLSAEGVDFERLLWVRCGKNCHTERTDVRAEDCHAERNRIFAQSAEILRSRSIPSQSALSGVGIPRSARNDKSGYGREEGRLEQALRVTDLLLQSGGFGMVAIDFGDIPLPAVRRIPLTTWFRFQRVVENTPTVLLVIGQAPCAQTCASLLVKLQLSRKKPSAVSHQPSGETLPAHAQLFEGLLVEGELLRSRLERKPAASVTTTFTTKAKWAG